MGTDGEALLAAIRADPEDDTIRLAFADWLEERGDTETAAYIRSEIAAYRAGRTEIQWDRVQMWGSVRGLPHVLRVGNQVWIDRAVEFLDSPEWVGREVWLATLPEVILTAERPDKGYVAYYVVGLDPPHYYHEGHDPVSPVAVGLAAYAKKWPGVRFRVGVQPPTEPGSPRPRRPIALAIEQITGRPVAD